MKVSASINSKLNQHQVVVQTNGIATEVKIPAKHCGYGSSLTGGELLLLSLATCFCNDVYREAAKQSIKVSAVTVYFTGEFAAAAGPGSNFIYSAQVVSDAPAGVIEELIGHTDRVAEIHNILRQGLAVTLRQ